MNKETKNWLRLAHSAAHHGDAPATQAFLNTAANSGAIPHREIVRLDRALVAGIHRKKKRNPPRRRRRVARRQPRNPFAICHASTGPRKTRKFEHCVRKVKAKARRFSITRSTAKSQPR